MSTSGLPTSSVYFGALLKMGSLYYSFKGVLLTITIKTFERCLYIFGWVFHYSPALCRLKKLIYFTMHRNHDIITSASHDMALSLI